MPAYRPNAVIMRFAKAWNVWISTRSLRWTSARPERRAISRTAVREKVKKSTRCQLLVVGDSRKRLAHHKATVVFPEPAAPNTITFASVASAAARWGSVSLSHSTMLSTYNCTKPEFVTAWRTSSKHLVSREGKVCSGNASTNGRCRPPEDFRNFTVRALSWAPVRVPGLKSRSIVMAKATSWVVSLTWQVAGWLQFPQNLPQIPRL